MNRVLVIISSLLISINVLASDWPHENISNAEFAMEIKDRTPLNIIEELDNSFGKIYFFTNIRNLQGQSIRHRWIYKNKVMAEVEFDINGPRWRVWSSKNLWPTWLGEWSVEVLNANSEVLYKKEFNYIEK
ncbi:MAG: DUF2914 domain-containing protein [Candidatus Pseudothioglobus sp.]|jgi:hypothetical protein|nr:hypothetical protein [bacterium]|tara:strand:+ start:1426 stop:1818 length:393 start_codon:yes stop_codon:yes gene_type:complete